MAKYKCGLRYCDATVADYNYAIDMLKCPCLKCLGDKCDTCDIYKESIEKHTDFQYQMCKKCKFHKGRQ